MPFQRNVNLYIPLAVEGDFADANPRSTVNAGEGGLVAGPFGVTVGQFAWVAADGRTVTNYAQSADSPSGFVHREQQGLITAYLQEYSQLIPAGFPVTLHSDGGFYDKVAGGGGSPVGTQVFASYADGSCWIGAPPPGATATGSIGASFSATGTGTNLTTSAVTGYISPGDTISGTGVPAGTSIVSQTSGTAGGAGVYVTSAATTAAAVTLTSFGNLLNVTAVGAGVLAVGDAIIGTGIPTNLTLASQVSPTRYTLSAPATAYVASTAITVSGGVLTNYTTKSVANLSELIKISTWGR